MKKGIAGLLLCAVLFAVGCSSEGGGSSGELSRTEASAASSSRVEESVFIEETASEESEAVVRIELESDEWLSARTEKDGIAYTYKFLFDKADKVFNAEACIVFPDEKSADAEYGRLAVRKYPNLCLDGRTLCFAFPKKECPYYGITFEVLPYLLENTIYEITEICARPEESSEEASE